MKIPEEMYFTPILLSKQQDCYSVARLKRIPIASHLSSKTTHKDLDDSRIYFQRIEGLSFEGRVSLKNSSPTKRLEDLVLLKSNPDFEPRLTKIRSFIYNQIKLNLADNLKLSRNVFNNNLGIVIDPILNFEEETGYLCPELTFSYELIEIPKEILDKF